MYNIYLYIIYIICNIHDVYNIHIDIYITSYIYYINVDSFCLAKSCVPKDPPELIEPNKVMVFEGLHPIYDEKANGAGAATTVPRGCFVAVTVKSCTI